MASRTSDGQEFNPVTGEIKEPEPNTAVVPTQATVPARSGTLTDLDNLPSDFDSLAAYFAEPEPDLRDVFKSIMGVGEMEERDPEETTRSILARIMSASTPEEILKANRVLHAQEVLGVPIEIFDVKWQRSAIEGGSTVYAVVDMRTLQEEQHATMTVGGRNVMMQLLNMKHRGFMPFRAVIQQSQKPTEAGYHPLWLEPA